ncbi:MAG: ATP-binding protein [Treponema sp.]|jgi:predicted AAA+ superfamily ATPase|nr:ATP-binding protein [Treponema sp.]
MQIVREKYLARIRPFIDTPFIKVLTGIRRSGKSAILELLREELLRSGVPEGEVVYINLEMSDPGDLQAQKLSRAIKNRIKDGGKIYLLLDEAQLVPGWEQAVNSLFAGKQADIFITGSNSTLLSSELSSLLSGRYVQFVTRPLSFAEYLEFAEAIAGRTLDRRSSIREYLRRGGFPGIHYLKGMENPDDSLSLIDKTVSDIFSSIVLKDVAQSNKLRNMDLLERVIKFLLDNTGSMVSARSISAYFKNQKRKVSVDTILEYISALEGAYAIEKARRYDIRGKKLLNVQEKYYSADVSFIHALLGYDDRRIPGIMENVIYNELRRREYDVFVGQYDGREIDFVAVRGGEKIYVQAVYLINGDADIIDREFGNLLRIGDQFPKYVVSLDERWTSSVEGVRHVYLPDFLLMEGY